MTQIAYFDGRDSGIKGVYNKPFDTVFVNAYLDEIERKKVTYHELGHKNHSANDYKYNRERCELQADRNMIHHLMKEELSTYEDIKSVKKKTATSIDDFKQKLKTNGFTIEREQEKSASLVQAKEGKGFVLSDGSSVEVYQYESNNPYFSKIKEDKKLLDQPVTIYGNFVVMIVNPTDSKNKILDSFKDFE